MSMPRAVCWFLCFVLLFGVLGGLVGDRAALATQESSRASFSPGLNQEEPPAEEKLELVCKYPTFEGNSGDSFDFDVDLKWLGSEARTFDLTIKGAPPKWNATIVAGVSRKEIPAIGLSPRMKYPETVTVELAPFPGELPEPGEYVITLEASSGDIKESVELKAVVTTLYRFYFATATERLSAEITAGKENHLALTVGNTGQGVIENISFTASKPAGWSIQFNPDEVKSLQPGLAQEIDAIIKPPRKTIAGDYMVTMSAISKGMPVRRIELRLTVLTPTIWGWVAIAIVLAVIAGLGVMFRRLGRR